MDDHPRPRVVVIDDHPVIAVRASAGSTRYEIVASFAGVEEFLRAPAIACDVVLLDLQLGPSLRGDGGPGVMGTEAIRCILDAGRGPVVVYTAIAEEMLLAACLAAGALGAVTKSAPGATVTEVVRIVTGGHMWIDPAIAGALTRYAQRRHAGALSPQQANALRYRGQGLNSRRSPTRSASATPRSSTATSSPRCRNSPAT